MAAGGATDPTRDAPSCRVQGSQKGVGQEGSTVQFGHPLLSLAPSEGIPFPGARGQSRGTDWFLHRTRWEAPLRAVGLTGAVPRDSPPGDCCKPLLPSGAPTTWFLLGLQSGLCQSRLEPQPYSLFLEGPGVLAHSRDPSLSTLTGPLCLLPSVPCHAWPQHVQVSCRTSALLMRMISRDDHRQAPPAPPFLPAGLDLTASVGTRCPPQTAAKSDHANLGGRGCRAGHTAARVLGLSGRGRGWPRAVPTTCPALCCGPKGADLCQGGAVGSISKLRTVRPWDPSAAKRQAW